MTPAALDVRGLRVAYGDGAPVVEGVDLHLAPGRILALVGSSGSGKSSLALALARLHPGARVLADRLMVGGVDLRDPPPERLRQARGRVLGMAFQDPHASLHPMYPAEWQVIEAVRAHQDPGAAAARARAAELLAELGLDEATARRFPHQLSGGQKQRVVLAMAMAHRPALIVADEPTSALDAEARDEVLARIASLRARHGTAFLLITHDLGLARRVADETAVLDAGRVVEHGPTEAVLRAPGHPRTRALLAAEAPPRRRAPPGPAAPLLQVRGLSVDLEAGSGLATRRVRVLHGVDLELAAGQTLALVGPSGSGKSTLARALLRLVEPAEGELRFGGQDVRALGGEALRRWRRRAQIVFQDPGAALDPRLDVGQALELPMAAHGLHPAPGARRERAAALLAEVGLDAALLDRPPQRLSGGQKQRVAIARALALDPELLVCDEVLSALDTESRAQVLGLLLRLQRDRGLAYVFITHDEALAAAIGDHRLRLSQGRVLTNSPPPTRGEA